MSIQIADLKCLAEIQLVNGTTIRIQNWSDEPLVYYGKNWNYLPFPVPPMARKMGEDAQSLTLLIPNVGSRETGNIPIRDWAQNGTLAEARITIWLFTGSPVQAKHRFVVAERTFEDRAESGTSVIKLQLRQPEDRDARILTQTWDNLNIGEAARTAPY